MSGGTRSVSFISGEQNDAIPTKWRAFFQRSSRSRSYRGNRIDARFSHRRLKTLSIVFLTRHKTRAIKRLRTPRGVFIAGSVKIRACGIYLKFTSLDTFHTSYMKAVRLHGGEGAFPHVDSFGLNNFKSWIPVAGIKSRSLSRGRDTYTYMCIDNRALCSIHGQNVPDRFLSLLSRWSIFYSAQTKKFFVFIAHRCSRNVI